MATEIGKRTKVDSSMIASVGYDDFSEVLEIEFSNGSVYQYAQVPKRTHGSLMRAKSVGSYFHRHVKDLFDERKL